jgi:DNA-binding NtrC family response regulator
MTKGSAVSSALLEHGGWVMSELALKIRALSVDEWDEERAAEMVGQSPAFLQVQNKVEKFARYREPVLITGESGVGKEMVAHALYLLSERRGRPYVSVNCALFQEGNLTVSELFGHHKGSFTGAIADRKGAFEQANGGVIFLDEIGELHPSAQSMLLRALATGEFKPLGSDQGRSADVRVVAATNRPIEQLALDKNFRSDLLFRLYYFHVRMPALREREGDWRLILEYVLFGLRNRYGVLKRFSPAALRLLEGFPWPGNVRQLVSVATLGYAMADGDIIEPDDFAAQLRMGPEGERPAESLYERVVDGGEDFWEAVYRPFMERDLNRDQVRQVVVQGLEAARGSYQRVLDVLHVPQADYQRFMDFLRHHRLKP